MEKEIFKVGDTVYLGQKKGVVTTYERVGNYPVVVEFDGIKYKKTFTNEGYRDTIEPIPILSFTPYETIKTNAGFNIVGFTQERPNEFKKGDLVWVQDEYDDVWQLRIFIEKTIFGFLVTSSSDLSSFSNTYKYCKPYEK